MSNAFTENREARSGLRFLRITASFALAGAVVVGVFAGWADLSFDPRIIGAAIGAVGAVVAQATHAL